MTIEQLLHRAIEEKAEVSFYPRYRGRKVFGIPLKMEGNKIIVHEGNKVAIFYTKDISLFVFPKHYYNVVKQ